MSYFSIYVPSKQDNGVNDEPLVFTRKDEALKVLKNYKDARLKIFKNNDEAINYAQTGKEIIITKFNDIKSPINVEKTKFSAPTKQELIQFRKDIEDGKCDSISFNVMRNPRYLVNLADTPTILKEGPRYHAIHVCAIHNKSEIAAFLLQLISNYQYIEYLHNNNDQKVNQETSNVLLDYYLNMPEKCRSETPLHLASKYGSADVIEILTAYPECKMTLNSDNLLPKDIICSRVNNPSDEVKERISILLEERFYVPVIRSVDKSIPPIIGEPFSSKKPPELNNDPLSPELKIQAYAGPIPNKEEAQKFRRRWKTPPRNGAASPIINSPYISPLKLHSSTPTKSPFNRSSNNKNNNNNNSSPLSSSINYTNFGSSVKKNLNFNFEDTTNGNISVSSSNNCNYNCNNADTPCSTIKTGKFTSTLTPLIKNPKKKDLFFTYRDKIASPIIFDDTDSYSSGSGWEDHNDHSMSIIDSPGLKERHLKLTDTEKGYEVIGRELAKEQNIGWKEYWDFLDEFIDITSTEGLEKLENYLIKKHLKESPRNNNTIENLTKRLSSSSLTNQNKFKTEINDLINLSNVTSDSKLTSSYLCIEKSLQVFAKRMKKTIINNLDSIVSIHDAFINELKRMESLVCSFRDDKRFHEINFKAIHSRFANLIISFIKFDESSEINSNSIEKIKKCFKVIVQSKQMYRTININNENFENHEKLRCLSEKILHYLNYLNYLNYSNTNYDMFIKNPILINTEELCLTEWDRESKCDCYWKLDLNRIGSFKRRRLGRQCLNDDKNQSFTSQSSFIIEQSEEFSNSFKNFDNTKENFHDIKVNDNEPEQEEEKDDEIFWSDAGSNDSSDSDDEDDENEKFYTPPTSPTQIDLDKYHTFLGDFGYIPTERDWHVLNALHNVEIDKEKYPKIYRWKAALLRYSVEEYENSHLSDLSDDDSLIPPSLNLIQAEFKLDTSLNDKAKFKEFRKYENYDKNHSNDILSSSSSLSISKEVNNCQQIVENNFSTNLSLLNISDV